MPLGGMVTAAALPAIGGIIGNIAGQGDRDKAAAAKAAALQQYTSLHAPTADELKVALQKYQSTGQLDPRLESALSQGPSALSGISTDPRLKEAQAQSLENLQNVGRTGLNATDLASLHSINNNVEQGAQARNASILQNMDMRGQGGSGSALAAQLINSQAASERAQNEGLNIGAQAQARALQAISGAGSMAQNIQGQNFNQQAQQGSAADTIARYNALNSQNVQNQNTNLQNNAQQYNLQNSQGIANKNTDLSNQQTMYNTQAQQQAYEDALQKASGASGQYNETAKYDSQQAANTGAMFAGIGKGLGSAASVAGGTGSGGGTGPVDTSAFDNGTATDSFKMPKLGG